MPSTQQEENKQNSKDEAIVIVDEEEENNKESKEETPLIDEGIKDGVSQEKEPFSFVINFLGI
jgi:hypothetical protein